MKRRDKKRLSRLFARQAAYMIVFSDARLLGIPECREAIVLHAANEALGRPVRALSDFLPHLTGENRTVALDARKAAYAYARGALEGHPLSPARDLARMQGMH